MAKKNRVIRYLIPVLAVLILAAWYGVSRYRGVGGFPLRTEETKNFIAAVKDICGGSVKVQYGFPQRVEITVDAPSLTDAETEELLELTAALMQDEDFAADFTRLHSRRYGKLGGYHVLPELAAPVGPDSVSVQLRTDDAAVTCSYYSGYPFEKWSGPSLS